MNETPAPPPAAAGSRPLATRAALAAAVLQVIGLARHTLSCADRDLAVFGLSSKAAVEALQAFLLGRSTARVRLLADAELWLERDAARLRLLQQRFPATLELRLSSIDDPVGDDSFLLADDRHILVRGNQGMHLALDAALTARPVVATFERRWQLATHNLPVKPLGL
jgi:hypothetical protein